MFVFFRTEADFDDLAQAIRNTLNVPAANRATSSRDQRRFGVNHGGLYYLFEVLGFELYLHKNEGEVREPEYADYQYYLYVQVCTDTDHDKELEAYMTHHLASWCRAEALGMLMPIQAITVGS